MKSLFSKSLLFVVIFSGALSFGLTEIVCAESRLNVIKDRGYMFVGMKHGAPFGFKDKSGNMKGFDADVCRYIANRLGVDIKFIPVTDTTRITAVAAGIVDIAAATLTRTKSRDKLIDYSITYFYDGQKILVKKGSGIKSYKDLAGKKVGAARGTTSKKNIARIQPNAVIVPFKTYEGAFRGLQEGAIDSVTTDSTLLLGLKAEALHPENYEIVGEFFSEEPYGLALPQNDSKWRDFVNESLIEMWNSGQWLKTYNRWLGPDTKYAFPLDFTMATWPLR